MFPQQCFRNNVSPFAGAFTSIAGYTPCRPAYIEIFMTIFGQCINVLNYMVCFLLKNSLPWVPEVLSRHSHGNKYFDFFMKIIRTIYLDN